MRKTKFTNNEYYHIYNRGVSKQKVFCDEKDYLRFLKGIRKFNNIKPIGSLYELDYRKKKGLTIDTKCPIGHLVSGMASELVEIICYCLNPNHYHFLLKQLADEGISKFFHKLEMGYAKYFNYKYNRSGSLFQGTFQDVHINSNEYLLWVSGYINGNAEIHKIAEAENYKWCSYLDYLSKRNGTLCNKKIILSQFKNLENYQEFVNVVIKESKKRKDPEILI